MSTALRKEVLTAYGDLVLETAQEIRFFYPVSRGVSTWRRAIAATSRGTPSDSDVFELQQTVYLAAGEPPPLPVSPAARVTAKR
jgi:hypothetical protein